MRRKTPTLTARSTTSRSPPHPSVSRAFSPSRHLLEPLDQPFALQARQALQPEHAVELIDLVLVAHRAQTLGLFGLGVAAEVLIVDVDARVTLDVVVDAG